MLLIDIYVIFDYIINIYINYMTIASYIQSILNSNQIIIWSWGIEKPKALSNNEGLIFHVNGFKHNGFVKVVYNEGKDLFVVILLDNEHIELKRLEDIYFDTLIDVIDEAVELTPDYDDSMN